MKKVKLKFLTEYFGRAVPVEKIEDRQTRMAIILLYGSLVKAYRPVMDEIEAIREGLVKGREEEVKEYGRLLTPNPTFTAEENRKRAEKAHGMVECERINSDFKEALRAVLAEETEADIKKVPLEVLYEALYSCGFPELKDTSLGAIQNAFEPIIIA